MGQLLQHATDNNFMADLNPYLDTYPSSALRWMLGLLATVGELERAMYLDVSLAAHRMDRNRWRCWFRRFGCRRRGWLGLWCRLRRRFWSGSRAGGGERMQLGE